MANNPMIHASTVACGTMGSYYQYIPVNPTPTWYAPDECAKCGGPPLHEEDHKCGWCGRVYPHDEHSEALRAR